MNELEMLTRLRDEVPLTAAGPAVERAVMTAITAAQTPVRRPLAGPRWAGRAGLVLGAAGPSLSASRRHRGLKAAAAGILAVAAGAAGVAGLGAYRSAGAPQFVSWSGRPTARSAPGHLSLGRARTEAQLVDFATRAAALAPGPAPRAHDWVFMKTEYADSSDGSGGWMFGPPDKRLVYLSWIRVDWREYTASASYPASMAPSKVVHGRLRLVPGGGGTLGGWKSVRYSYLSSLPSNPARLEAVILADNNPRMPWYSRQRNVAIFKAICTLLQGETEGAWIPPRLAATMYQVLQRLPGVHFDSGTDLAGRPGIGLYMVLDGWYEQELVINPQTYAFMGDKTVAAKAHTSVALDGTRHIRQGQVLGWDALLESAIVHRPGQVP